MSTSLLALKCTFFEHQILWIGVLLGPRKKCTTYDIFWPNQNAPPQQNFMNITHSFYCIHGYYWFITIDEKYFQFFWGPFKGTLFNTRPTFTVLQISMYNFIPYETCSKKGRLKSYTIIFVFPCIQCWGSIYIFYGSRSGLGIWILTFGLNPDTYNNYGSGSVLQIRIQMGQLNMDPDRSALQIQICITNMDPYSSLEYGSGSGRVNSIWIRT